MMWTRPDVVNAFEEDIVVESTIKVLLVSQAMTDAKAMAEDAREAAVAMVAVTDYETTVCWTPLAKRSRRLQRPQWWLWRLRFRLWNPQ